MLAAAGWVRLRFGCAASALDEQDHGGREVDDTESDREGEQRGDRPARLVCCNVAYRNADPEQDETSEQHASGAGSEPRNLPVSIPRGQQVHCGQQRQGEDVHGEDLQAWHATAMPAGNPVGRWARHLLVSVTYE